MATYNTGVFRGTGGTGGSDPLVPQPLANEIIQMLPKSSIVMNRARKIAMSTLTERIPVLSVLPQAYWLGTDTTLKQTTTQAWQNVQLIAGELAALVPIPNAYIDDAGFPLWDEIKPRLVEAIGYSIDAAAMFGTAAPTAWTGTPNMYQSALNSAQFATTPASGNASGDVGSAVATLAQLMAMKGYAPNGFIAAPGFGWNLASFRNAQGNAIYQPNLDMQANPGGSLYGYQLDEVVNGAFDTGRASLLAVNWNNAIIGTRQDITFSLHEDGVISDGSGVVQYNAMQQDSMILRVVFRAGFATANPVTRLAAYGAGSGFGVLEPVTSLEAVGYGS